MNETGKSSLRRSRDPAFIQRWFVGAGIDIGAGSDPLSAYAHLFPRLSEVFAWDLEQGNALYMRDLAAGQFDFVHSSHCLEHLVNPFQALSRWLELVKPGGYVVVTVPDEDLYEKSLWPSRFNSDHKFSFTVYKPVKALPDSVNVLDLVMAVSHVASCERISAIHEHYDERRHDVDQTAHGVAECAIEIVLRKRQVPDVAALLKSAAGKSTQGEAREACLEAVRTYPYRFEAYHGVAMILLRWGLVTELDALWDECVRRLPNEYLPRLYRALHVIAAGRIQEGFRLREALMTGVDWAMRTKVQPPGWPAWKGESLEGRSIVIWSEFGLGDEIFFFRFARLLKAQGARQVSVVCQLPLTGLFRLAGDECAVYGVDEVDRLEPHDYWVFPHAIPACLPLDLNHLPAPVPYLYAPRDMPVRLPGNRDALKVGIVFRGAATHENDQFRSLASLGVLDPLFDLDGVEFYSLQKGAGAQEAAEYARRLSNFHDLGIGLDEMTDTARVLDALDVLVSVDTSVANLAGAMGRPVCLMLPTFGDWRWHYLRDDSPWYPGMRLFRQEQARDWVSVVERICEDLVARRELHRQAAHASNPDGAGPARRSLRPPARKTVAKTGTKGRQNKEIGDDRG